MLCGKLGYRQQGFGQLLDRVDARSCSRKQKPSLARSSGRTNIKRLLPLRRLASPRRQLSLEAFGPMVARSRSHQRKLPCYQTNRSFEYPARGCTPRKVNLNNCKKPHLVSLIGLQCSPGTGPCGSKHFKMKLAARQQSTVQTHAPHLQLNCSAY